MTPVAIHHRGSINTHILYILIILSIFLALITAQTVVNDGVRREAIRLVNTFKCMHGQQDTAKQWYKYSPCVENFAQTHATYMATNNVFEHSGTSYKQTGCDGASRGLGENIAAGHRTLMSALNAFYRKEVGNINWSNPKDDSKGTVGHATAMLWSAANLFGGAGGYNSGSSYKYYWSTNMGSGNGGTAPNTSSAYLQQVTPIDPKVNYTICEALVFNYYNTNPSAYFVSGTSNIDGFTQISGVTFEGTSAPGQTVTVKWTASNSNSAFNILFCDVGTSPTDTPTTCTTIASPAASARSASVTIPKNAAVGSKYGTLCVQTSDAYEKSCAAGLTITSGDGPTPSPIPTPATYSWKVGEYGSCQLRSSKQTCGPKVKRRSVTCVNDSTGESVDATNCQSAGSQPATESLECDVVGECQNGGTCGSNNTCECKQNFSGPLCEVDNTPTPTPTPTYAWKVGEYGSCQLRSSKQTCGPKVKQRKVECVDQSTGKSVSATNCQSAGSQPATESLECDVVGECQNGGTCGSNNTCECKQNFSGPLCEVDNTPTPTPTPTYAWKVGEYGSCQLRSSKQTCGPKVKHREVECVDQSTGKSVDATNCQSAGSQPATESLECDVVGECQNGGTCGSNNTCECKQNFSGPLCEVDNTPTPTPTPTYAWKVGEYGSCQLRSSKQTCGPKVKHREVECVDQSTGKSVSAKRCKSAGSQPATESLECDVVGECQNGGTCGPKNTCRCKRHFSGPLCEVNDKHPSPSDDQVPTPTPTPTPDCPVGFYGVNCRCKEIYMTLPFPNPDANTFPKSQSGLCKDGTTAQREYFAKLIDTFSDITSLPTSQFFANNFKVSKDGKSVKITFAVRKLCTAQQLSSPVHTHSPKKVTKHPEKIRTDQTPTSHPDDSPPMIRQPSQTMFHPLQAAEPDNNVPAEDDDMSSLYDEVAKIIHALKDPESPHQQSIPQPTGANGNATAALPAEVTAENAVYDPGCTGDTCPNGVKPAQPHKDDLTWAIIVGVVCGVLALVLVAVLITCCIKCCRGSSSDSKQKTTTKAQRDVEMQ